MLIDLKGRVRDAVARFERVNIAPVSSLGFVGRHTARGARAHASIAGSLTNAPSLCPLL
jgi:hypothetical protein